MAVIRPNILTNAAAMKKYTDGVNLLKNEFTGPTTISLGIPGPSQKVSTYDLFVIWQVLVLSIGLAVLYRRRTQPVATTLLVLYAVIAVIVAFVRRGAGA